MRAVIQKVLHASVVVDGRTVSSIGRGLMILVGIGTDDTPADASALIKKILNVRLFEDGEQMWKKSVKDIAGEVLCVSQFTLLAKIDKGSKPDFHGAMTAARSKSMYSEFLQEMGEAYDPACIKDGEFGAMMQVSLCNDGPVTITYDTKAKAASSSATPSVSGQATPVGPSSAALIEEDAKEKARIKREAKQEATRAFLARKAEQQAAKSEDQA